MASTGNGDTVERNKMSIEVLSQMKQLIDAHLKELEQEDQKVEQVIASSGDTAEILREAKNIAFDNAVGLFGPLQTTRELASFLQDIIMIENVFNDLYSSTIKKSVQEKARNTHAPNIEKYEQSTAKLENEDVDTFERLIFRALIHVATYNTLLNKIERKCAQKGIVFENSGAQCKGMERAFYKTYYMYGNDDGYKYIKDVLRASFVFNSFDDLYRCFSIIEQTVDILRVKDRFQPEQIQFGYRDCLINFHCPSTKIVVELQLHLKQFYDLKKISHKMYKRARLFNSASNKNENIAYNYAHQHIRPLIGDKKYDALAADKDDTKEKEKIMATDDDQKHKERANGRVIDDGVYFIYVEHSGKALDVEGGSKKNGAKILQFNIHGGDNQKFVFKFNAEKRRYTIQCKHSGLYMDVAGGSDKNCTELLQWPLHGGKNQLFELVVLDEEQGIYRINTHCGKSLDIDGGSALNCAKVIQYAWHGHDNQRFRLKACLQPIQDGCYFIAPSHAVQKNMVLDVEGGSKQKIAKIIQYQKHGGENQQFLVKYEGDGVYCIQCKNSGLYWDIEGGSQKDGAKLIQWSRNLCDNQFYKLIECGNNQFGIMALHSGKYIDIEGGSQANCAAVIQWTWHGGPNQRFTFKPC